MARILDSCVLNILICTWGIHSDKIFLSYILHQNFSFEKMTAAVTLFARENFHQISTHRTFTRATKTFLFILVFDLRRH